MRAYFSKRHKQGIEGKRLDYRLPFALRNSILRVLQKYSDTTWYENGKVNLTFDQAEETLKTFYGMDSLRAYDGDQKVDADFAQVIRAGWPPNIFDCIEAWLDHVPSEGLTACESELNQVLAIHDSKWRFMNGSAMLIDSDYIREEIIAPMLVGMREQGIDGALQEFTAALDRFGQGEYKESVVSVHKSVESVMKCVLETDEHLTFRRLLLRVLASGLVPQYYEEFFSHFEKLALGAAKERNRPGGGHGQGRDVAEIERSLAQFAVHLAACINLFLLERWIVQRAERQEVLIDDLPFE